MRCLLMILAFLFISIPISTPMANAQQSVSMDSSGTFIHSIGIQGFVLQDKNQFIRLFKPYRNKSLTASDLDGILQKLQEIYEQAGYQGLVSIDYQILKKTLTFRVSLIK